jgi:ATP-dependent protease ClpP protease subunit
MKKLLCLMMLLPTLAFGNEKIVLEENNTISFNNAFSKMYVAKKQAEAINLCYSNVGSEINVVLYTPGGSVSAGQLFFDTLKALPCKFNTITIFAASMGYQTVQNLGNRYIIPSGVLMSHRAWVRGLGGEIGGELDSILDLLKQNILELDNIASSRVGITLEQYRSDIADELWLTASKAVETNHADKVVLVECGQSLRGTYIGQVANLFGRFDVEFHKCPIITAPLRILKGYRKFNTQKLLEMYDAPSKFVKPVFDHYNNARS